MLNKITFRSWIVWVVGVSTLVLVVSVLNQRAQKPAELEFSAFREAAQQGHIAKVQIEDLRVRGQFKEDYAKKKHKGNKEFTTLGPVGEDLQDVMLANKVSYSFVKNDDNGILQALLVQGFFVLLLVIAFVVVMRQFQGGGGRAMTFGKSRAKLLTENQNKVMFSDIAGIDEAKEELREVVDFLKHASRYRRLGGRIPKGVLLMGPPGTGKTLLARGVAGEAGVSFFSISGSDFVEMFVGVGASRVRDLFEQAKKHSPCIIFIDEIDAVGRHRGAGMGGGNDEREQTLNQLLVEMDGFEANDNIILIAATNRPDVLDPALLRPGRFDRRVVVSPPDVRGREMILKIHTRRTPLAKDVDLTRVARGTPGFSGADLENLVNEAALMAARHNKTSVEMADFEEAKDKVLMGAERKNAVIGEKERKLTAYHEAGHALVALLLDETDPVHKVTIIPRGRALGVTQQLPSEDRYTMTRKYALNRIAVLMGGRAAEELIFDEITSGAGNDIEVATETARRMVCEWGMSALIGPLRYAESGGNPFLGGAGGAPGHPYSEEIARKIDGELQRIITEQYDTALSLLRENNDLLELLTAALLEFEALDADEIKLLLDERNTDVIRDRRARAEAAKKKDDEERAPRTGFSSKLKDQLDDLADDLTSPAPAPAALGRAQ